MCPWLRENSILSDAGNTYGYDLATPRPGALIESLRAIGYSVATAVADLIDNCISAGSRNVWLDFYWDGSESYVEITDDGRGMQESDLIKCMTIGSISPLEVRSKGDLGRFGLGLKTASFSQCRKLTVRSKIKGSESAIREWDLDHVVKVGEWQLARGTDARGRLLTGRVEKLESGTSVLWRELDRIVDKYIPVTNEIAHARFRSTIAEVERHIGSTFHRFIASGRIKIRINDKHLIKPWDPFLSELNFTQNLPEETVHTSDGAVVVRGFVLPHHSKLTDEQFKEAAGARNWNAQQGLYIYRGDRLLVQGGWGNLGLAQEAHYQLARVSVDIPNALDSRWELDIKKSRAVIPGDVRRRLYAVCEAVRNTAKQTYRARGKILSRVISKDFYFVWNEEQLNGKLRFRINRQHPIVDKALSGSENRPVIAAALRIIEETLPLEQIWFQLSGQTLQRALPFAESQQSEITDMFAVLRGLLSGSATTSEALERKLQEIEPFNQFPDLIKKLSILDQNKVGENNE